MIIDGLFCSPTDTIAKFAEMQVHLYRHDASLQNYFHVLDEGMFYGRPGSSCNHASTNRLMAWSIRGACRASQVVKPRKIKTDILFCPTPYFGRKTENRFVAQTLFGLADTDATILCLLPGYTPFRQELEREVARRGYSKQITFLDPRTPFNAVESRMRSVAARLRGRAAFEEIVQILEPHGLTLIKHDVANFERAAEHVEAWERLAPFIEFDAVVSRCHWYEFCSPVCHTGMERDKTVITFQQGVIGHTLDFPIIASKFVTFGAPSASVLAEGNRRFFDAVGISEPPVEYFNAGSLFDTLLPLPDQFSFQTVLLIDLHSVPGNTWGDEGQVHSLVQLAEELLSSKLPLRRVIIRPHPQWNTYDLQACVELAREHRDVCELSHPLWSLEDDLRRSSVVVGIWSGALTVASACGLPTIFIAAQQGFKTKDLACFSPEQTLMPDAAFRELSRLLTDPESYAEARKVALQNAREYYAEGSNASLDGEFFRGLLGDEAAKNGNKGRSR